MERAVIDFVLRSIKPEGLVGAIDNSTSGAADLDAKLIQDGQFWAKALDVAEAMQCGLQFAIGIDRSSLRGRVPEFVTLKIDERIQRERMILAILDHELDCALFLLISAGIPVLVSGGMDLGRRYYPERILRQITMLTLMVQPEKYLDAIRVLGRGGYRSEDGRVVSGHISTRLCRSKGGPVLELSKQLFKSDSFYQSHDVWNRAVDGTFVGLPGHAKVLKNEDCFVCLVRMYAGQHMLNSPLWLNDIHFLINQRDFQENVDWDWIIWTLANHGAISGAWFLLNLLSKHWGTNVPKDVLAGFEHEVGPLRRKMLAGFLSPSEWFGREKKIMPSMLTSYLIGGSVVRAFRHGIGLGRSAGP